MTARAPMKPQTLTIPAPAPWINANARDHWTKKGRLTRSWRSASAAWARHQKLRPVTQPVVAASLSLLITPADPMTTTREGDPS